MHSSESQASPRLGLIGYGSWATALSQCLTRNKREAAWWVGKPELAKHILSQGRNASYLPETELDLNGLSLNPNLREVVDQSDFLLLCVPSAFIGGVLDGLPESAFAGKTCVSFVKGLDPGSGLSMSEYLKQRFDVPAERFAVVSGPSHAEEVAQGAVTYLTAASDNSELALQLCQLFQHPRLRLTASDAVMAVEFAGVLKNIYTIGAGLALGLGYGDNFLAVYVGGCLREMRRFFTERALCPIERLSDSAYLGDLLTTAYSPYSRNRTLGRLVGEGLTTEEALAKMKMVAEGYYAARLMVEKQYYEQPIARLVYETLYHRLHPQDALHEIELILR